MIVNKDIKLHRPWVHPRPNIDEPLLFSETVIAIDRGSCVDVGYYDFETDSWEWFTDGPEGDWFWYYPLEYSEIL